MTLATPNGSEAQHFSPGHGGPLLTATTARARELARRWSATAVSVTLSGRGALVVSGDGAPSVVPAPVVPCPDPCGAGDRYASTAAGLLADGALPSEAVAGAVAAASAFVAAGGAASVRVGAPAPAGGAGLHDVVARVRAAGGTVVATGGCFDLLHAGHVAACCRPRARSGDCLVVLLNSDDSVRRLKGATRPLQAARRPQPRCCSRSAASTPSSSSTRTPPSRRSSGCGPTSGSRAATTPWPTCPRHPSSSSGAARRSSCPT